MSTLKLDHKVKAPIELVWSVIADPVVYARAAPKLSSVEVLEGEGVGMRRLCREDEDRSWIEHCVAWDEPRKLTMTVESEDFPYPFSQMHYSWKLRKLPDDAVLISMEYVYKPRFGPVGRFLERWSLRRKLKRYCELLMHNWDEEIGRREAQYRITVDTILGEKEYNVISIEPSTTIGETVAILAEKHIGAVLVMEEDELVGLVSERDVVRVLAQSGDAALHWPASKIMTRELHVCSPQSDLDFLMQVMSQRNIRHLPVLDDHKVVGMVSMRDVVSARIHKLEIETESMRIYIAGRQWRWEHRHQPVGG